MAVRDSVSFLFKITIIDGGYGNNTTHIPHFLTLN
jgi:hypothetical protein